MVKASSMIARALRQTQSVIDAGPEFPDVPGYDLVDLVGRGGMGVVYEALQRSTGRRCAVKLLWDRNDPGARERFGREIELAARLEHPNIVRVFDAGGDSDSFYAMEFVEGCPLDERLEPGRATPRAAAAMLAKICRAVDYAHQRGVLHRDLKPSNILVDDRGEPRVLDFGLAKAIGAGAGVTVCDGGRLVGTLGFLPPEQACGRPSDVGVRSDVYALGAIGYFLICGRLPTDTSGSLRDVLERLDRVDPPAPSRIRDGAGRDLDAVLLKALGKDPRSRYGSAEEMAADLQRFVERRPVLARQVSAAGRGWRLVRRNPALAAVCAAAVLALMVVCGVAFQRVCAERDRAVASEADARRASAERSAALRSAMDALDRMVFEANDQLAAVPEAAAQRANMLARAAEYLEQVRGVVAQDMPERAGPVIGKLADWAREQGQVERAARLNAASLALAREAAAREPQSAERARELGFALWRNGMPEESAAAFERVLLQEPQSGRAMVELAIPLKYIAMDGRTAPGLALRSATRAMELLAAAAPMEDLDWFSRKLIGRMTPGISGALARLADEATALTAVERIESGLKAAHDAQRRDSTLSDSRAVARAQ